MRFYVAGPYSDRPGIPPGIIEESCQIAWLQKNYPEHEFISPYTIPCDIANPTHAENMRVDCAEVLRCDAIVLRPGWSTSKGAMIELNLAVGTGRPVYTYHNGYLLDPEAEMYQ